MSSARSAAWLVYSTREWLQVFDKRPLRDGFSYDPETLRCTSILEFVNKAINSFLEAGYSKCKYTIAAGAGVGTYQLDSNMSQIDWVRWQGKNLQWISEYELQQQYPAAYTDHDTTDPGPPIYWWARDTTLGVYPVPASDDPSYPNTPPDDCSIFFEADSPQPDLVNPNDIPARLVIECHDYIPVIAAAMIAIAMSGMQNDPNGTWAAKASTLYGESEKAKKRIQEIVQSRFLRERDRIRPLGRWGRARRYFGRGI